MTRSRAGPSVICALIVSILLWFTPQEAFAQSPIQFDEISYMKILDNTCISSKFNRSLFQKYSKEAFAGEELSGDLLNSMQYADIGYALVVSREDYERTGIMYFVTMGDRRDAKPSITYCSIMIKTDEGNEIAILLKNNYGAFEIDRFNQGLSSMITLKGQLVGYNKPVLFSIQSSKLAGVTILSIFEAP